MLNANILTRHRYVSFRLSQWSSWVLQSSGMYRSVRWWLVPAVLKQRGGLSFKGKNTQWHPFMWDNKVYFDIQFVSKIYVWKSIASINNILLQIPYNYHVTRLQYKFMWDWSRNNSGMFCLHVAPAHVYETNGRAREAMDKWTQYGTEKIRCACRVIIIFND